MQEFKSMAEFSLKLLELQATTIIELHHGLERAAKVIEKTAKSEIGTYQNAVGPFPAWVELKDATKADRVRQGYSENDPGYRSGEMQESIEHHTSGLDAEIGSNDDKLVWFELGTSKQDPRPVLGPAAYRNKRNIELILGHAAVTGLLAGTGIHPALKYDFDV